MLLLNVYGATFTLVAIERIRNIFSVYAVFDRALTVKFTVNVPSRQLSLVEKYDAATSEL